MVWNLLLVFPTVITPAPPLSKPMPMKMKTTRTVNQYSNTDFSNTSHECHARMQRISLSWVLALVSQITLRQLDFLTGRKATMWRWRLWWGGTESARSDYGNGDDEGISEASTEFVLWVIFYGCWFPLFSDLSFCLLLILFHESRLRGKYWFREKQHIFLGGFDINIQNQWHIIIWT